MLGKYINHCEDSLTASVFTHLLHLPSELFWQILRNACYSSDLPEYAGEVIAAEPWPNWAPEGTENTSRVIPDLFLRFVNFDIIVEAKRWDGNMQKNLQWQSELVAYTNEYGNEQKPVRMLALGVPVRARDEKLTICPSEAASGTKIKCLSFVCPVHMCRWDSLLSECQRAARALAEAGYSTAQNNAHQRILADLISLFAWHGFFTGRWFADFSFQKYNLFQIDARHDLFRNRSKELSVK